MKILVCISNVPDTTTKIKFTADEQNVDTAGIQWVINPWDELALTRAIELKENAANNIQNITVAHVGDATSEPTIRKALAIGADSAIRVNSVTNDALDTAKQLANAIKDEGFDIILCGIESSDHNGSTVGGMLSELLNLNSVTGVSSLEIEANNAKVIREIDGGKETLLVPTPALFVVQKGIAKEPRIAAMRGIMQARTKPIKVVDAVANSSNTNINRLEKPQPRAACKFIEPENAAQLISLLQNEAKII